jgi:hypothetical protein
MAQNTPRRDLEPQQLAAPTEPEEAGPETWWSRHGAVVFAVGMLVAVGLLILFNMK